MAWMILSRNMYIYKGVQAYNEYEELHFYHAWTHFRFLGVLHLCLELANVVIA